MNALLIKIVMGFVLMASLAGCHGGGVARYDPYSGGYYTRGYHNANAPAAVRTAPCQPFNADALMQWAKGAGDKMPPNSVVSVQTQRQADVNVHNGLVNCHAHESTSSGAQTITVPRK